MESLIELINKQKFSVLTNNMADIDAVFNQNAKKGVMWAAYNVFMLGYIYGKRADRERRKAKKG